MSEQTTGTDLPKLRTMQAGRFQKENLPNLNTAQTEASHDPPPSIVTDANIVQITNENIPKEVSVASGNEYENMDISSQNIKENGSLITCDTKHDIIIMPDQNALQNNNESCEHCKDDSTDSEAESETQIEYTDHDLDEVLLNSDEEDTNELKRRINPERNICTTKEIDSSETPPLTSTEDHYLPMSPRKTSNVEPAHKTIINSLSVFDQTLPQGFEDNPYVEMNIGGETEDTQNYEIVCVNNGKIEPVYMELTHVCQEKDVLGDAFIANQNNNSDTASNFADTKDHTLKRATKSERNAKEEQTYIQSKVADSDADDEASKDISLDTPFNRFSISDTFRPASYYLGGSKHILDTQDSSDSEILSPPPIPNSSPPCDELSDEALSKYVLDKLDKSNLSQDNSILKMLTNENKNMNTIKKKTTSLMIYGSRTSIHDTLSRGEKVRNSRASLSNDKSRLSDAHTSLLSNSIHDHYNSNRSIETDSLVSYNADRGSSRLSLESDISSKFEMGPSNISSEVTSLNESDTAIELRHSNSYRDIEMINKRRPLSDNSFFEMDTPDNSNNYDLSNIDLDRFLNNLQTSDETAHFSVDNTQNVIEPQSRSTSNTNLHCKNNVTRAAQLQFSHVRCSSTPVAHSSKPIASCSKSIKNICDQQSGYTGSQSSCSSGGITKSPMSYYCKDYDDEHQIFNKNLNSDTLSDKIKDFENEKNVLRNELETNASSSTTGFHSRESSTEHSAPYYYSDLSSQEHLNISPTSHYLKNTNLHRKLNNQRRRGLLNKKNDISHIHNPIHNTFMNESFELAAATRSVSVEFLCAADKDTDIDIKNIYESTSGKISKIPESMSNLMSTVGCQKNNTEVIYDEELSEVSSNSNAFSIPIVQCSSRHINASTSKCQDNTNNLACSTIDSTRAYENLICQGDKLWDEDALWRDNLRRVSHRHAKSMDDLDALPDESRSAGHNNMNPCCMSSLKRLKKGTGKRISRNVTYVNSDIHNQLLNRLDDSSTQNDQLDGDEKIGDNDVYVSLAENTEVIQEQSDEGVYELLAMESVEATLQTQNMPLHNVNKQSKKKFEIDREKLRQWDLMSSGLMKGGRSVVRVVRGADTGLCVGAGEVHCSTDSGADSASNEGIF